MSRSDIGLRRVLHSMLTENTGRSGLDSGGAYGRNWERNQGLTIKALDAMPSARWDGYCYIVNVYHFLLGRLWLDDVCKAFNKACVPAADWEGSMAYGLSRKGNIWLTKRGFQTCQQGTGYPGFNTYNESSPLSQDCQGTWLTNNSEYDGDFDYYEQYYLLLQIHGGCDVRGGYTDARLFRCAPSDFFSWDVYGTVKRPNGDIVEVCTNYTGYSLTTDSGKEVEIKDEDEVSLFCPECC